MRSRCMSRMSSITREYSSVSSVDRLENYLNGERESSGYFEITRHCSYSMTPRVSEENSDVWTECSESLESIGEGCISNDYSERRGCFSVDKLHRSEKSDVNSCFDTNGGMGFDYKTYKESDPDEYEKESDDSETNNYDESNEDVSEYRENYSYSDSETNDDVEALRESNSDSDVGSGDSEESGVYSNEGSIVEIEEGVDFLVSRMASSSEEQIMRWENEFDENLTMHDLKRSQSFSIISNLNSFFENKPNAAVLSECGRFSQKADWSAVLSNLVFDHNFNIRGWFISPELVYWKMAMIYTLEKAVMLKSFGIVHVKQRTTVLIWYTAVCFVFCYLVLIGYLIFFCVVEFVRYGYHWSSGTWFNLASWMILPNHVVLTLVSYFLIQKSSMLVLGALYGNILLQLVCLVTLFRKVLLNSSLQYHLLFVHLILIALAAFFSVVLFCLLTILFVVIYTNSKNLHVKTLAKRTTQQFDDSKLFNWLCSQVLYS